MGNADARMTEACVILPERRAIYSTGRPLILNPIGAIPEVRVIKSIPHGVLSKVRAIKSIPHGALSKVSATK